MRRVFWSAGLLIGGLAIAGGVAAIGWHMADPDQLWRQARAEFEARRFDETANTLKHIARLRAPTPLDWMLRAQVAIARNQDDEALADLAHLPDEHPMAAQARMEQGQIALRHFHARQAEQYLLEAVRLDPKLIQARRELVYIYGMQSRRKPLGEQFRKLSALGPLSFDDVFTWCLTRGCVWDPADVLLSLDKYVQADPDDRWSRLARAESLRQLVRLREAEQAMAALPDNDPDARATRVRIALDRGDDKAAEALLAEGPADHADLAHLRGRLAFARHDVPAALKHLRLAYAADPDNRDTQFLLGQTLRQTGDEAAAKPLLEAARNQDALNTLIQRAAVQEERTDIELTRKLSAACEKLGRLAEARAWCNLVIAANPLDQAAQQALYRIDTATKAALSRNH